MSDDAAADRRGVRSAFPFGQFVGLIHSDSNLLHRLALLFLDYPPFLLRSPPLHRSGRLCDDESTALYREPRTRTDSSGSHDPYLGCPMWGQSPESVLDVFSIINKPLLHEHFTHTGREQRSKTNRQPLGGRGLVPIQTASPISTSPRSPFPPHTSSSAPRAPSRAVPKDMATKYYTHTAPTCFSMRRRGRSPAPYYRTAVGH